jgi:DNA-binding transcriptional MerR regulator/methylmalonyl-CoA mutase cobalamin-binding subunit
MYTIKQAALRSGLSVTTVRVWERRYGVVRPTRTTAGYRLYDDAAIARLIAMRQLVDGRGMRPSQAAELLAADGADVDDLVAEAAARSGSAGANGAASARTAADAIAGFVDSARALDVGGMEHALDETFAAERFESAMEHVVFPALRAIGDGWAGGELDVAMEHAASETVRRRLARFFDTASRGGGPSQVIVGLPPGSHHEIGALAFAVAARRAGLDVLYLGADVPLESWLTAATTTAASVAVIGVVSRADARAAMSVVSELQAAATAPPTAVGGAAAHAVAGGDGTVALPDGIDDAVARVRELANAAP